MSCVCAVLDPVVDHLDVSRASAAKVRRAGVSVDLRGNFSENRRDAVPRILRPAGHHRWAFPRAFLSPRHTNCQVADADLCEVRRHRRSVFSNHSLPPSMRMSPSSTTALNFSMSSSTALFRSIKELTVA